MKTKRTLLIIVVALLAALWIGSFCSPELAIRRYMLLRFHPISTFIAKISNMGSYDPEYGYLYDVKGYVDRTTGDDINVFYLKKNGPFWIVSSTGTGP
ncbi:hypothetical protein IJ21_27200 [Paenibacillus sp. 32O-W]|nr:hypothetical protein IJ21_27200 [Paenibacillus sp. 32O-W]